LNISGQQEKTSIYLDALVLLIGTVLAYRALKH